MRVLIADDFSTTHLEVLRGLGLTVDFQPDLKADQLPEAARQAAILVVRSTEVKAAVFEAAGALSLVIRAGAGVNTIDVAAASARGVYVANCPGQNSVAVAELAFGLILAWDRRIPDNVAELRAGHWRKKRFSKARGLSGRTLGLLGTGAIACETGRRALAFGMRVDAYSRSFTEGRALQLGFCRKASPLELARGSDVLSVHVPASSETRGLVSRQVLAALPDGALLVNTSRAEVVDTEALLAELRCGRLFLAADVFEGEPKAGEADFSSALTSLPNVYGTHHIGASTQQAQEAIARETLRIIERFLASGEVPNCVNVARRTPARYQLIIRHQDRVGVLANVLSDIREAGINVQELENTVFEGAVAACCKVQLDSRPPEATLARIRGRTDEVIFVDLVEL